MFPNDESDYTYTANVYYCKVCPRSTGTKNWRKHLGTKSHKRSVAEREATSRPRPPSPDGIPQAGPPAVEEEHLAYTEHSWACGPGLIDLDQYAPPSPSNVRGLVADLAAAHAANRSEANGVSQASVVPDSHGGLLKDLMTIAAHKGDNMEEDERPIVRTDKRSDRVETSAWYPFKSKLVSPMPLNSLSTNF
ncbi:hypothetical protein PtA15_6A393 [Puccinia triticina]|uniref:U1-type domain-containing protein n=1 Tax=Puccinia triticina TaxID=208348 RepID=A0ABY7CM72_9BASI|nr:uncharacterized protein PtA15_6A393 [Puccinia triticina]WAQ85764.1 hypothetical protein PtA15_6A393 [Puccinia triticina]